MLKVCISATINLRLLIGWIPYRGYKSVFLPKKGIEGKKGAHQFYPFVPAAESVEEGYVDVPVFLTVKKAGCLSPRRQSLNITLHLR